MAAASPLLRLGLLHMWPIQFWLKQRVPSGACHHGRHHVTVTRACVSALARWRNLFWKKQGVILDTAHRRKVVMTDASNKGWGAQCEGKPTFGLWSEKESGLHINCLEMLAVCQSCQFFLPDIRGHYVLVCSDNRSVVSYINHQGGLVSKRLCTVANNLLVWAQTNLHSLKATHVPGKMNHGADMFSRNNVSSGEWTLHPLAVQKIWEVFGRAQVDLFASKDKSHSPFFFTKSTDALAHERPSLPLYAFLLIALLPQVLRRVREQRHKLILIAPLWRNQPWVSELFQLLEAAPWSIPLRWDILSQANGTLWHPQPPERAPIWTIVIHEPQSTLVKNRPAASIGIGQASRRPAGPIHQPSLPGIRPNASKVVLKARLGHVPKVLSTPLRAQVIAFSVLSPLTGCQELSLLCPVRALRVYIERSASYRKSE